MLNFARVLGIWCGTATIEFLQSSRLCHMTETVWISWTLTMPLWPQLERWLHHQSFTQRRRLPSTLLALPDAGGLMAGIVPHALAAEPLAASRYIKRMHAGSASTTAQAACKRWDQQISWAEGCGSWFLVLRLRKRSWPRAPGVATPRWFRLMVATSRGVRA
jgi:hypothetical protein